MSLRSFADQLWHEEQARIRHELARAFEQVQISLRRRADMAPREFER